MSSIDDELALFESEISSIVQNGEHSEASNRAEKVVASQPSLPLPSVPVHQPLRPFMPSQLTRPPNAAPLGPPLGMPFVPPLGPGPMLGQPRLPIPGGMPFPFVPHQLRVPLPLRGPTGPPIIPVTNPTIESAPSIYKDSDASTSSSSFPKDGPKTTALASDIEAFNKKKEGGNDAAKMRVNKPRKFVRTAGGQVWEDNSLSDWDPSDFRIFCGDLGNEVSDELLAKAFRKYPSFLKAKVIRDGRSNKSKGYGFVSFKSQEDYVRAIREMDGKYVGNRPIKLRKSQWKDRQIEVVKKKQKQKAKLGLMY